MLAEALRGAGYLGKGLGLWRTRPRLMLLGMLPALLVFLVVTALLVGLLVNLDDLVGWVTPFADDWADGPRSLLRFGVGTLVVLAALLLAAVTFTGLTLAVGDPFYERIWREVELSLGGPVPEHGLGFWRSARDGIGLAALGLLMALIVVAIGFVPVVGPVAGTVIGLLVSGRLLAAELVARPLEARGMSRRASRDLLRCARSSVYGFGIATQLFFLIPLGAVVVMPAAVAGSTMLARDLLTRRTDG